jgi:hypothetical protein
MSVGGRASEALISKRGNRSLRVLLVQVAWVLLIKPKSWRRHGLQVVARGGQEAAASQRPRHRARQQAMVVAGSSLDRHTTAKEAGLPKFKVSAWVAYVLRVQSTNRSINMSRLYSRGA